jgi:hypothetical protein
VWGIGGVWVAAVLLNGSGGERTTQRGIQHADAQLADFAHAGARRLLTIWPGAPNLGIQARMFCSRGVKPACGAAYPRFRGRAESEGTFAPPPPPPAPATHGLAESRPRHIYISSPSPHPRSPIFAPSPPPSPPAPQRARLQASLIE